MDKFIVDSKTLYSQKGRGVKWTVKELQSISHEYKGFQVSDSDGLFGFIRVLKSNKISIDFKYSFRWEGKQKWFICGTFPKHDLADIRLKRNWAQNQLKNSINPIQEMKSSKAKKELDQIDNIQKYNQSKSKELTFNDLFNAWINGGVSRKNSNFDLIQSFNKHVNPILGKTKITEIEYKNILQVFKGIKSNATPRYPRDRTILKIQSDLNQLFRWALQIKPWNKLLDHQNPMAQASTKSIISNDYNPFKERVLSESEIIKLGSLIENEKKQFLESSSKRDSAKPLNPKIEIAIWLCISTMCRIGELLKAKWEEVDFTNSTWTIPPENIKKTNSITRQHIVHLSPFALAQFKKLWHITNQSNWCFPAQRNDDQHVLTSSYTKMIGDRQVKFKERTKAPNKRRNDNSLAIGTSAWTMHDLRRTGATLMQKLKISSDIIDLCQNHEIRSQVRRAYQQYEYLEEKQNAWNQLGAYLEEILQIR